MLSSWALSPPISAGHRFERQVFDLALRQLLEQVAGF
jgi:hypothetical protein